MADTMKRGSAAVEYRFNHVATRRDCPLCGASFEPRVGSWPFLAGSDEAVCAGDGCPIGEDVTGPSPCNTLFEFVQLSTATLRAVAAADLEGEPVAERLRRVALDDALPDADRAVLQLAAIDLQFCEAERTQIRDITPGLVLQTCPEAAAEMLLSGCGAIVE